MKTEGPFIVALLLVGFILGVITGGAASSASFNRRSMEGQVCVPTYITNSVGEVAIVKVEWKKK